MRVRRPSAIGPNDSKVELISVKANANSNSISRPSACVSSIKPSSVFHHRNKKEATENDKMPKQKTPVIDQTINLRRRESAAECRPSDDHRTSPCTSLRTERVCFPLQPAVDRNNNGFQNFPTRRECIRPGEFDVPIEGFRNR